MLALLEAWAVSTLVLFGSLYLLADIVYVVRVQRTTWWRSRTWANLVRPKPRFVIVKKRA